MAWMKQLKNEAFHLNTQHNGTSVGLSPQPPDSGVARAFLVGWVTHPEDQNEEENKEHWGKMRETTGKWGKIK